MSTAAAVRQAFDYDPATGAIERKDKRLKRRAHTGTVNRRKDTAYAVLCLDGKKLYAHRVAWMHAHGDIPPCMVIDHVDGDGLNNRLSNLRLVTKALNQRNRRVSANSRTGVTGVVHHKNGYAVSCAGQYIGHFSSLTAAIRARREAEPQFGYLTNDRKSSYANS